MYNSAPANYFPRRYLRITPPTPPPLRPPTGPGGGGGRLHSGFWALITTRTSWPARAPWSRTWDHGACRALAGFLPLDADLSLTISPFIHGLRSLPHLPNIVSAVSKRWQVGVGGVVRSRYSQKGWSAEEEECGEVPSESICTQRDGSLWSPRLHLLR